MAKRPAAMGMEEMLMLGQSYSMPNLHQGTFQPASPRRVVAAPSSPPPQPALGARLPSAPSTPRENSPAGSAIDGEGGRQRGYAKRMGVTEKGILGDDDMAAISIQKAWRKNRLRKGLRELARRCLVMKEILASERVYVDSLTLVQEAVIKKSRSAMLSHVERQALFGFLEPLIIWHQGFYVRLQDCFQKRADDETLERAQCKEMRTLAETQNMYKIYAIQYANLYNLQMDLQQRNPYFASFIKTVEMEKLKNTLQSFYILPVQRPPRYMLLLRELLKYVPPRHVDYAYVNETLAAVKQVADYMNTEMRAAPAMILSNTPVVETSPAAAAAAAAKSANAMREQLNPLSRSTQQPSSATPSPSNSSSAVNILASVAGTISPRPTPPPSAPRGPYLAPLPALPSSVSTPLSSSSTPPSSLPSPRQQVQWASVTPLSPREHSGGLLTMSRSTVQQPPPSTISTSPPPSVMSQPPRTELPVTVIPKKKRTPRLKTSPPVPVNSPTPITDSSADPTTSAECTTTTTGDEELHIDVDEEEGSEEEEEQQQGAVATHSAPEQAISTSIAPASLPRSQQRKDTEGKSLLSEAIEASPTLPHSHSANSPAAKYRQSRPLGAIIPRPVSPSAQRPVSPANNRRQLSPRAASPSSAVSTSSSRTSASPSAISPRSVRPSVLQGFTPPPLPIPPSSPSNSTQLSSSSPPVSPRFSQGWTSASPPPSPRLSQHLPASPRRPQQVAQAAQPSQTWTSASPPSSPRSQNSPLQSRNSPPSSPSSAPVPAQSQEAGVDPRDSVQVSEALLEQMRNYRAKVAARGVSAAPKCRKPTSPRSSKDTRPSTDSGGDTSPRSTRPLPSPRPSADGGMRPLPQIPPSASERPAAAPLSPRRPASPKPTSPRGSKDSNGSAGAKSGSLDRSTNGEGNLRPLPRPPDAAPPPSSSTSPAPDAPRPISPRPLPTPPSASGTASTPPLTNSPSPAARPYSPKRAIAAPRPASPNRGSTPPTSRAAFANLKRKGAAH